VRLETNGHSSWGNKTEYVNDPSLSAGTTKVIERGSSGRKCTTWRVIEKDGVEVKREKLFDSIYRASPRVVARGTRAKTKKATPAITPEPTPTEPPGDGTDG
jgi:uncharacterized protein YabE (DUF348 family)